MNISFGALVSQFRAMTRFVFYHMTWRLGQSRWNKWKINMKMDAVIGSVAAVNVFLEGDEDEDLEDIKTSPAILSFFNIQLNI